MKATCATTSHNAGSGQAQSRNFRAFEPGGWNTPPRHRPIRIQVLRKIDYSNASGAVLLEVLLALILFTAAAAVVTTAFNASVESLERQKFSTQALNLAASVIAEVQLGIRDAGTDSARPFEKPFQDWTWETAILPSETPDGSLTGLTRLEVIIRHTRSTTVQRLAQVVRLKAGATTNSPTAIPTI